MNPFENRVTRAPLEAIVRGGNTRVAVRGSSCVITQATVVLSDSVWGLVSLDWFISSLVEYSMRVHLHVPQLTTPRVFEFCCQK